MPFRNCCPCHNQTKQKQKESKNFAHLPLNDNFVFAKLIESYILTRQLEIKTVFVEGAGGLPKHDYSVKHHDDMKMVLSECVAA